VTAGTDKAGHRFPIRIYYEDTDAAGIVYYANYLKYAERARTEWLRMAGTEIAAEIRQGGLVFVVRRCEIDYSLPARLDDLIEVETRLVGAAGAVLDLDQTVLRGDAVLVRMRIRLACVNAAGRPARLPAALRAAFETPLQTQECA